ncbi:MAG: UDP-N-acetylmuramoyl-L-alanine--D-glutamate ligase [Candidatus Accumulibacter sp.]|nr:UDP-N-acetylmuramoyl-L-alanine--D-glutamate ligase [Accumulibacter sp.]
MDTNLAEKTALTLGLGESGLAMAKWLARAGAALRVADSRRTPPNAEALMRAAPGVELYAGEFPGEAFKGIDLIALSPGVPLQTPQVQDAMARGVPVVSEIELFAWGARREAPQSQIVAITGSNGKTTTTALTAHLLNGAGIPAVACGNISPSALDALMAALDTGKIPAVWVLELSSYQLETTYTLNADAATVLNVSEDHLDRHAGMDAYAAAKARVFQGDGLMLINRDDARCRAWENAARKTIRFGLEPPTTPGDYGLEENWIVRARAGRDHERLVAVSDLQIAGRHNAANAMAALALCEAVGARPGDLIPALKAFKGLPHRVEPIAEIGGVTFYDDSKGTNVGATLAAVRGLGRKVALILGGEGKEQDFSPLAPALAEHARAVALIGRDAPLIERAVAGCGKPMQRCGSLEEAVRWCARQAAPGDAVLLSPACASFDMFRNYAHRSEVFAAAVRALQEEAR